MLAVDTLLLLPVPCYTNRSYRTFSRFIANTLHTDDPSCVFACEFVICWTTLPYIATFFNAFMHSALLLKVFLWGRV